MCLIEYWLSCYFTLYHLTSFRLESKLLVPAYCLLSASAVSLFIIRLTEYIPAPLTESGFTVWHCKYIENFLKIHIPQYIWNGLELIGIRWNKISLIFPQNLSDKSCMMQVLCSCPTYPETGLQCGRNKYKVPCVLFCETDMAKHGCEISDFYLSDEFLLSTQGFFTGYRRNFYGFPCPFRQAAHPAKIYATTDV